MLAVYVSGVVGYEKLLLVVDWGFWKHPYTDLVLCLVDGYNQVVICITP